MRPIGLDDINRASFTTNRPLLILDTNLLVYRWVFLAAFRGEITSPKGKIFPEEIWCCIASELKAQFEKPQWVAVRPENSILPVAEGLVAVRCTEVYISPYINDMDHVYKYETFFANTTRKSMQGEFISFQDRNHGPARTLTVAFPVPFTVSGKEFSLPPLAPCLFTDVTVPDYIARVQGGYCWVCRGARSFCPGCTEVSERFDAMMGCGVDLACPLCMGLEFCWQDKDFWQTFYWKRPSKEEQAEHDEWVDRRREELGYDPYLPK